MAIDAAERFLAKRRVLYAAPTQDQTERFWKEIVLAFAEPIDAGIIYRNQTSRYIEIPGTEQRIKAKTAWNADSLRGDYADYLILDEFQLMDENAWDEVGAPMLLDNNGDATFIYTPPSIRSRAVSKAKDKLHAAKMYKLRSQDTTGRWATFHFTSHENPYISREALADISQDMTALSIRQEIMAEDIDEIPGALWTRELIEQTRVQNCPALVSIVVGVDPPGGATECGVIVAGIATNGHLYIVADYSVQASPDVWGNRVIDAYVDHKADSVVDEKNYGGDMVEAVIVAAARSRGLRVNVNNVQATRGKAVRAEPVAAMFERGEAHIVGELPELEEELTSWTPMDANSPNRLDAMVWAATPFAVYTEPSGVYAYDGHIQISKY